MTRWILGYGALALAFGLGCGPSYGGQGVKTPEELVAEQEQLAEEQAKQSEQSGSHEGENEETDLEKRKKFDKKQADLELKRAQRSAETCAGVVTEEGPTGTARITLVFANDGSVKESSISAPFTDTPIGSCALNAMKAVVVPPFVGPDETVEWEIDLTPKEKDKGEEKDAKKK